MDAVLHAECGYHVAREAGRVGQPSADAAPAVLNNTLNNLVALPLALLAVAPHLAPPSTSMSQVLHAAIPGRHPKTRLPCLKVQHSSQTSPPTFPAKPWPSAKAHGPTIPSSFLLPILPSHRAQLNSTSFSTRLHCAPSSHPHPPSLDVMNKAPIASAQTRALQPRHLLPPRATYPTT
jgi:hypothetical protein